jgi:hypothetical protein
MALTCSVTGRSKKQLLHPALLLDLVSLTIEPQFDRQATARLRAHLVEAMDGVHHVAAAIGTDPGRFQPIIPIDSALRAAEIVLDAFD